MPKAYAIKKGRKYLVNSMGGFDVLSKALLFSSAKQAMGHCLSGQNERVVIVEIKDMGFVPESNLARGDIK